MGEALINNVSKTLLVEELDWTIMKPFQDWKHTLRPENPKAAFKQTKSFSRAARKSATNRIARAVQSLACMATLRFRHEFRLICFQLIHVASPVWIFEEAYLSCDA